MFLQRFWKKYRNKSADERIETFLQGMRPTPVRLAAVHRYLMPDAERAVFDRFLKQHLPDAALSEKELDSLYTVTVRAPTACPIRPISPAPIRWTCGCSAI